ncbi:MAG: peptidylprolyl isomerase [Methylococcaceae bacterium]|nr:peptidylprolyl isomerase [Methylococcaceae bacterium]
MKKNLLFFLFSTFLNNFVYADKVLVTIGESGQVTEQQLESAMLAAPFATQFPGMDENDQAYLRGDLLLRMARAEALYQEAVTQGKNQSSLFLKEMGNFKTALLAQRYLNNLRQKIQIPEQLQQQFTSKFKSNSDALVAARSAYVAKNFTTLKNDNIKKLIQQAKVKTYFEKLDKIPTADTVLAEGIGLRIKYGDLIAQNQKTIDKQRIVDKVNEWVALILTAKAAIAQGENVDSQTEEYAHNLTIRLLLAEKEQQWIPDEKVLLDYYQEHPNIAYIPERRQIGQIVLGTIQEAEDMLIRIKAGESLFELAGQYSIDPYGRQRSGDMGWIKQGNAAREIEQGIKKLKDNEVSEIIKTDKGWHLVVIVNRKPSERKDYAAIKDRVRQKFIAKKMTDYLQQVMVKYPLQWQIEDHIEKTL